MSALLAAVPPIPGGGLTVSVTLLVVLVVGKFVWVRLTPPDPDDTATGCPGHDHDSHEH